MEIRLGRVTLERLDISADEWELYTTKHDCTGVAREINEAIIGAVNTGCSRAETERMALRIMRKWDDRGAMDSEPLAKLDQVLDRIFGRGR